VFTVGWEPSFANEFLAPIEKKTGIGFVHGLVGDASRIYSAQKLYPELKFIALSKRNRDSLPAPDISLLTSLESVGVPTVRSMIQGDRVLRHCSEDESLGYATLLAGKLKEELEQLRPDAVLASHDSLHSAMSLAVARLLNIPWVALAFPVIPDNLTGFCNALTPNSLVPIIRPVDESLRSEAKALIQSVRAKNQKVVAYHAPVSLVQWIWQYALHVKNLIRRIQAAESLGTDKYTYPTTLERVCDILRRTFNRLRLPIDKMLKSPPDGRYIYYPFHMAPESMLDTWAPYYQDQLAFVAQLSLAIPADTTFVVKLHFSDPDNYSRQQLDKLMSMPRLRVAHPSASGGTFIEKAALVAGVTGTSCLEAALLGKPVLVFGDSPYANFPRSERARRPDGLYKQIRRMLDQPSPTDEEIINAYATYMARYMPGRINDWSRPIEPDELVRYAECFRALIGYLSVPENRENWYSLPPFSDCQA